MTRSLKISAATLVDVTHCDVPMMRYEHQRSPWLHALGVDHCPVFA